MVRPIFTLVMLIAGAIAQAHPIVTHEPALSTGGVFATVAPWQQRLEETTSTQDDMLLPNPQTDEAFTKSDPSRAVPDSGRALAKPAAQTSLQDSVRRSQQYDDKLFGDLYRSFSMAQTEIQPVGADRGPRARPQSAAAGEGSYVHAAESVVKEAITAAMEAGILDLSRMDLEGLAFAIGGLRQMLRFDAPEISTPWSDEPPKPANTALAGGTSPSDRGVSVSTITQSETLNDRSRTWVQLLRDMISEPIVIMVLAGMAFIAILTDAASSKSTGMHSSGHRQRRVRRRVRIRRGRRPS